MEPMRSEAAGGGGGRLEGRRALISGASRGIGQAIARTFAAEGADLYLVARNVKLLRELRSELKPTGRQVHVQRLDVSDRDACFEAVRDAEERLGRIDVLVNNASIFHAERFLDYSAEDFRGSLEVNLFGAIHMMQAALPAMIDRSYGKVVNVASTAGKKPAVNRSAYSVSKHALVGLTRCVALEVARSGVTVNAICPGAVETDMLDELVDARARSDGLSPEDVRAKMLEGVAVGRALAPEEVATLAVYLAAGESDGMTGQSIALDGGVTFF